MDKSVFLYCWFSFDLKYYLVLGGTNNALHFPVPKSFAHFVGSAGTSEKSLVMTETIATRKFPDYVISCDCALNNYAK